jgi:hypothetical protein
MFVELKQEELIGTRIWAAGSVLDLPDQRARDRIKAGEVNPHTGPEYDALRPADYKPHFPDVQPRALSRRAS